MKSGYGPWLSWLAVAAIGLAILLLKFGVIPPDDHAGFATDCASRGGRAVFEPYTTCFDSSGKPEGVPYR